MLTFDCLADNLELLPFDFLSSDNFRGFDGPRPSLSNDMSTFDALLESVFSCSQSREVTILASIPRLRAGGSNVAFLECFILFAVLFSIS